MPLEGGGLSPQSPLPGSAPGPGDVSVLTMGGIIGVAVHFGLVRLKDHVKKFIHPFDCTYILILIKNRKFGLSIVSCITKFVPNSAQLQIISIVFVNMYKH